MLRRRQTLHVIMLLVLAATVLTAQIRRDYLTEDELDIIRDAQEIDQRVPAYFGLAEKRLIVLGLMEKSEKEEEQERKDMERWEREKERAEKAGLRIPPQPVSEYAQLENLYTRSELLRGYIQVLDEVMTNIDDAYSRRLDVRSALEDLEQFSHETQALIEKFQPGNDSERLAMEDALEVASEAHAGAKEALSIVPRTERRR